MWMVMLALACADGDSQAHSDHVALVGGHVVGVGLADVTFREGVITAVGEADPEAGVVDVTGRYIVPAFIDSHVHLEYWPQSGAPVEAQLADGGVAAVVDLAAPDRIFAANHDPIRVLAAGPMVTAPGGYPTMSWGSDGYGRVVADASEAANAVDSLLEVGAGVIKIPVTDGPTLSAEAMRVATDRAHGRGVKVAAHALDDGSAAAASEAGMDVLAHTPVMPLSESTLASWSGGAVVSTLVAFGDSPTARANLMALQSVGATVLYGTDLGNRQHAGIDGAEIAAMQAAGMTPEQILMSGTRDAADHWGWADLGRVEVGARASLLVLAADPLIAPSELATPQMVFIDGTRR